MLQEYLPPGMPARLDRVPEELLAPKHPSQVAFEALHAAVARNGLPVRLGLGRRARMARARLGAGGGVVDGGVVDRAAAVALRGRAAERAAMWAETASQAPWRAAIAAARELKQAICDAGGQVGEVRNDPTRGSAMGAEGRTRDVRNDPICGPAVRAEGPVRGTRNDPTRGSAVGTRGQARDMRNDPICGSAVCARAAGVPLDARVRVLAERRDGRTTEWAPGSRGLREALVRELEKRRLRADVGLRGNDPARGQTTGREASVGVRTATAAMGLVSTRALALGTTTLAQTWEPSVAEMLSERSGPAVVAGWTGPPVVPPGIAAVPSGERAQRPCTRPGTPVPDGWGNRSGRWPGQEGSQANAACSTLTRVARAPRPWSAHRGPSPQSRARWKCGRGFRGGMSTRRPAIQCEDGFEQRVLFARGANLRSAAAINRAPIRQIAAISGHPSKPKSGR